MAKEYLERNYRWEDGTPIGYWEEERLGYDELGNSEVEYVAHLESGIQVIFYPNGEFSYEYDPYKRERDAGLTFNNLASNYGSQRLGFWNGESEGPNPVYVDIRRIDGDVSEQNSLMYRISLLNRFVGEDATPSLEDYDLSGTDFPAGTPVTLTINYESDDPRYFIVSGSEVSGFKNRYPESWLGTPGSFTIKAKTVDPVASESNPQGDIGSTFSITVQMGADRYYGGAIFETNVIGLDTGFSKLSDPSDQAFSFDLKGLPGTATKVRALMPKSVLNHQFWIWEASEVKAGIADPENGIRFVRGSRNSDQEADDPDLVGFGFHRILHKGRELDMYMPGYDSITGPDDDEFLLVDNELFGFDSSVLIEDESSQRRSASTGRRSITTWSSTETIPTRHWLSMGL